MNQNSRPISDVAVTNFTPTPAFSRINEETPDDLSFVASNSNPQGSRFEVLLNTLSWPQAGVMQLSLRLRNTESPGVEVTVLLLQGGLLIAYRKATPSTSFADLDPPFVLTDAEKARITDFTNLRVLIVAGTATTSFCSLVPLAPIYYTITPAAIANNNCSACTLLNDTTLLIHRSTCTWTSGNIQICSGNTALWELLPIGGVWRLSLFKNALGGSPLAQWTVSAPTWNGTDPLLLTKTTPAGSNPDADGLCRNYPNTITLAPL
jgi:hypothetical protein